MVVNELRVSTQAKASGYIFTLYQIRLKTSPRVLSSRGGGLTA
jgi:hypothetical protein